MRSDESKSRYRVERLGARDTPVARAKALFSMMAAVFDEKEAEGEESEENGGAGLSDAYVGSLLAREDFWALAATAGDDDEIVGGLTAHVLPMTRSEARELFIYDLAVRVDHQRRGVGRMLMEALQRLGVEAGIKVSFVPADDEDQHALDFYRAIGGVPAAVTIFTFEADAAPRARDGRTVT